MPHTFHNVGKRCGMLWGGPPGLSGWACGPRIVMKTMWGGRGRPPQAWGVRPSNNAGVRLGEKYAHWAILPATGFQPALGERVWPARPRAAARQAGCQASVFITIGRP